MTTPSLLDRAGKVESYPFAHVVIPNCLPGDYYAALLDKRPSYERILGDTDPESNKRIDRNAKDLLKADWLPDIWRDFVAFHTSRRFWRQVCSVFPFKNPPMTTGVRFRDPAEVFLDCQLGVNTPALSESRVRGPHVDNPVEVFAGLLYMGEDTLGGDLHLYERIGPLVFNGKAEMDDSFVRSVKTIPYRHNTLVAFVNTVESLHGVTPRQACDVPRWLVNVCAEVGSPTFEVPRSRCSSKTI